MRKALTFIFLVFIKLSFGQIQNDNHWILSNYIHLQFDSNTVQSEIIDHPDQGLVTSPYHSAISADNGDLLFHSGGCYVMDKFCHIIENGDSLNPGITEYGFCVHGETPWYQGVISLPYPGSESKYILFTLDFAYPFPSGDTIHTQPVPLHLYYHIIDMSLNNGLGSVIEKNEVAISDTLSGGYIQACQHGNGRDWWIIVPKSYSNCYHILYISPFGVMDKGLTCEGLIHGDLDYGGAVDFSQNGEWYARSIPWINDSIAQLDLFSFDRCTGNLKYFTNLKVPLDFKNYIGLKFSPNSRFLYMSVFKSLWQFDLLSGDIQNSLQLAGKIQGNFTSEKGSLYFQQLAPNGKIYISTPASHKYLSTIHYPDRLGNECGFKEHDLHMPFNRVNFVGLPNYPNYRLGPVDGSECDSLGQDNIPVAWWRNEDEVPGDWFTQRFTDLSYFNPETWYWDFDDGNTSSEQHPVHTFEPGNYHVCLTVSNAFSNDSSCHWIEILPTDVHEESHVDPNLTISPNPFSNELYINSKSGQFRLARVQLFDIHGRLAMENDNLSLPVSISTNDLVSGIYICKVMEEDGRALTLKVVKLKE